MPSKAKIQAQLSALGDGIMRLERDIESADSEIRDRNAKRTAVEDVINGPYDQKTKDAAQRQHDDLCRILADLYARQEWRVQEMERLKDLERTLASSLRSAR